MPMPLEQELETFEAKLPELRAKRQGDPWRLPDLQGRH